MPHENPLANLVVRVETRLVQGTSGSAARVRANPTAPMEVRTGAACLGG
jgi:hypothetical protein